MGSSGWEHRSRIPVEREYMDKEQLWQKCVDFHGHTCGGLTIGYRAALYAIDLLGLSPGDGDGAGCLSADEEIVCIAENDACGCDAIQVILGCSIGKGNLLFHMRGKQAFSFYDRRTGRSVRLVLKPRPEGLSRGQSMEHYHSIAPEEMFDVKETRIPLPLEARSFGAHICPRCGEETGENWMRVSDGEMVCLDCFEAYDRFDV